MKSSLFHPFCILRSSPQSLRCTALTLGRPAPTRGTEWRRSKERTFFPRRRRRRVICVQQPRLRRRTAALGKSENFKFFGTTWVREGDHIVDSHQFVRFRRMAIHFHF